MNIWTIRRSMVLIGLFEFSCATQDARTPIPMQLQQGKALKVYDALKLAVMELDVKCQVSKRNYELCATKHEESWWFTFTDIPAMPGGHLTAIVTPDGKVTIFPGA